MIDFPELEFDEIFDFDKRFDLDTDENHGQPRMTARKIKIQSKARLLNKMKNENVKNLIDELPLQGESLHIISNGRFDYFNLIPVIQEKINKPIESFWFSTWTMNQNNALQLVKLYDEGKIKQINAITGLYFKKRERLVYFTLNTELNKRCQKIFSSEIHAKVSLLKIGNDYFVIESSANFTANPRVEQSSIFNNKELYEHHKNWMLEIFANAKI